MPNTSTLQYGISSVIKNLTFSAQAALKEAVDLYYLISGHPTKPPGLESKILSLRKGVGNLPDLYMRSIDKDYLPQEHRPIEILSASASELWIENNPLDGSSTCATQAALIFGSMVLSAITHVLPFLSLSKGRSDVFTAVKIKGAEISWKCGFSMKEAEYKKIRDYVSRLLINVPTRVEVNRQVNYIDRERRKALQCVAQVIMMPDNGTRPNSQKVLMGLSLRKKLKKESEVTKWRRKLRAACNQARTATKANDVVAWCEWISKSPEYKSILVHPRNKKSINAKELSTALDTLRKYDERNIGQK